MNALYVLLKLDALLLFHAERLAHRTQRLFGWDNFAIAEFCIFCNIGTSLYDTYLSQKGFDDISDYVYPIIWGILFDIVINGMDKRIRQGRAYRNSFETDRFMISLRLLIFAASSIGLAMLVTLWIITEKILTVQTLGCVNMLTLLGIVYFMSCTPLPPGESKLDSWTRKLVRRFLPTSA